MRQPGPPQAHHLVIARHAGELVTQELADAPRALGDIAGYVTSGGLLGRIVASFCIDNSTPSCIGCLPMTNVAVTFASGTPAITPRPIYGASRPLEFAVGRPFDDLFEAVIGAEVAREFCHDGRCWDRYEYQRRYYRRHDDANGILKGALVGAAVVSVAAAVANSNHDWRARVPRGCPAMPGAFGLRRSGAGDGNRTHVSRPASLAESITCERRRLRV